MENLDVIDDEVIADSEGEMGLDSEEEDPGIRGILSVNSKNAGSHVSAFTLMGQFHDKTASSISAFTAGPSAVWKQNSIGNDTNNQPPDVDDFIGIASIADRAKTRQRNPNSSIQSSSTKISNEGQANMSSDIIELTSDDDEFGLRPLKTKPKSKPKARPKPKFNAKDESRDRSNDKTLDVPGTTEVGADKSADAILRPYPRPRPLVKRSKTAHESTVPPLPPLPLDIPFLLPSSSGSASHGPELPIATSPVRSHLDISYLPPSDPPLPTLTTIHDDADLPRIETLPNFDFDGPLSSPSSLFSDFGDTTKKGKRTVLDRDIDELASDSDLGFEKGCIGAVKHDYNDGVAAQVLPPHMLPPPPTFFAGSSSSIDRGRKIPPLESAGEVVDLTMLPSTIESTGALAKMKDAAQAKKSRRKKGDAKIPDEDRVDDDFDPTEFSNRGKAKSKPKPKPKLKTKKSADLKTRQGEGQGQVEVLIISKPRTQRTKGKGKEKATAKDIFKSREFIDDSGDEEDLIPPNTKDLPISDTGPSTSTIGKGAHTSVDTSVIAPVGTTLLETNTVVSPGNNSNPEMLSISSSSNNRMNRKRKSIIESDPEDEDEEKDDLAVRTSAKKHKGNDGSNVDEKARSAISLNPLAVAKKGKKRKNVVRSDEDESDGLSQGRKSALRIENDADEETSMDNEKAKGKTKSKAGKNSSKDDNNAYMEDHGDTQDQQPAPEAKENVVPSPKPTAKTSNPDDRLRLESPALFPSLHSRYEIAPRRNSLPMSELIRRANSIPGSPFATPYSRTSSSSTRSVKSGMTYSPYLKSSRSFLSRIAPLHPNRRTPPPPPPPPPLKKKTKKELELEEKWEEELIDSLGGISEWTCLGDDEKKELRRAKWAKEMGDWDD